MNVEFRTHELSSKTGFPTRAQGCQCGRQVVDRNDGLCVMCGREVEAEIDREWAQQAWRNKKKARRSTPRPFREMVNGKVRRMVFEDRAA
jgi:hypothetical protein